FLTNWAIKHGLQAAPDLAANVVFSLPGGCHGAPIVCGSHVDSVPQGGNYDGLAGIVAGLLCLKRLKDEGVQLRHPLWVLGRRGEESAWFGKAYMGSSAILGKLAADDLALRNKRSGKTLADAMRGAGADVEHIGAGKPVPWVANVKA